MPSARESSPLLGFRSSTPPGRRTSGIADTEGSTAEPAPSLASVGSTQVWGSRWARANSSSRRVSGDSRGPTISGPMPWRC